MMKHFYPDETGLFEENNASVHRARRLSESFNEYENDVKAFTVISSRSNRAPLENLWNILD